MSKGPVNRYTRSNGTHPNGICQPGQPIPKRLIDTAECFDDNFRRFIGWEKNGPAQGGYDIFFGEENIDWLMKTIHKQLGLRGYNMVVTSRVLSGVMSSVWRSNVPVVGDIYTIFNIPNSTARNDIYQLNGRVIATIVNTIIDEMENTKVNESLTKWTTVYGDFNEHGLRSHDIVKVKENDYRKGFFVENY